MSKEAAKILQQYPLPVFLTDLDGEKFQDYLEHYFDNYVNLSKSIASSVLEHADTNVGTVAQKEYLEISGICNALQHILATYLEGHPARAFFLFESMVEKYGLSKDLLRLNIIKIPKRTTFFRTQKDHKAGVPIPGNYEWNTDINLSSGDIFHAPFNKRKRVGTNRFSIPGYPCLYISDSLTTSYKECTQHNKGPINAICLKNNRPLYIADIAPLDPALIENVLNGTADFEESAKLSTYLKLFPIVAACHTKVQYQPLWENEVLFKVEYILPQLLLQWFQRYSGIYMDGVRYQSCTAAGPHGAPYNFIMTTQFMKGSNFCPKLSILFSSTGVMKIGSEQDTDTEFSTRLPVIERVMQGAGVTSIYP